MYFVFFGSITMEAEQFACKIFQVALWRHRVSEIMVFTDSGNGLSPFQYQAMMWTSDVSLFSFPSRYNVKR